MHGLCGLQLIKFLGFERMVSAYTLHTCWGTDHRMQNLGVSQAEVSALTLKVEILNPRLNSKEAWGS